MSIFAKIQLQISNTQNTIYETINRMRSKF